MVVVVVLAGLTRFALTELPKSFDGRRPNDFPNYWVGARRVLEGRRVYTALSPEVKPLLGWDYSDAAPADTPFTVVLLSPLGLLPFRVAWWVLAACSFAVMTGVTWSVAREVGWPPAVGVAAAALALVSTHYRYVMAYNHLEPIVLLASFLGWRALRHGRDAAGGIWWGAAAALKVFPALLLVALVFARRWRAAAWMAASAGVLTLAGAAVLGAADTRAYLLEVLPQARHFLGRLGNFSLLSIGVGLSGPGLGWTLEIAGVLWVLSVLARRPGGADRTWLTATSGALMISPLSWVGYPILVLPGLLVLARVLDLGTRRDRLTLLLLTLVVGFWIDSLRLGPGTLPLLFASVPTVGFGVLMELASRRLR